MTKEETIQGVGESYSIVDGTHQSLPAIDRQEVDSYEGKTILVLGGVRGSGLIAGVSYAKRGARVVLGTSDLTLNKFDTALYEFREQGIDTSLVTPFPADLRDPQQILTAIGNLKKEGLAPTDVANFAAGGMEGFGKDFYNYLQTMHKVRKGKDPEKDARLAEMISSLNSQLEIWLPQYKDQSVAINVDAPRQTLELLAEAFPDGFTYTFLNSTFGHLGEGPHFYQNVLTKNETTKYLRENGQALAKRGIYTAEIVAPVIEDTDVGLIIMEDILPYCPGDLQKLIYDTRVQRTDVAEATQIFLDYPEELKPSWKYPYTLYVLRQGGTEDEIGPKLSFLERMPEELRIDTSRFPF